MTLDYLLQTHGLSREFNGFAAVSDLNLRVRPGHITVHLLEAMPTRGLTYEDRSAVLERLRALAEHEIGQRPGGPTAHAAPSR